MSAHDAENLIEGPPSGDFDIPPAIACAHCGEATCEGCAPESTAQDLPSSDPALLPWEREQPGAHERLLETSELTAVSPQAAFGRLGPGSTTKALTFAVLCEVWAVASFTLLWGAIFYAVFPFVARQMLSSPAVLIVAGVILAGLIAFVVAVHALWGLGLEWGVARAGGKSELGLGVRFGLYACGWDLLTSPAGVWFQWRRSGWGQGWKNIRAGTKAPRASVNAYLKECRRLTDKEQKAAVWTSIWLGLGGVGLVGLALFAVLMLAWLPWVFAPYL